MKKLIGILMILFTLTLSACGNEVKDCKNSQWGMSIDEVVKFGS